LSYFVSGAVRGSILVIVNLYAERGFSQIYSVESTVVIGP